LLILKSTKLFFERQLCREIAAERDSSKLRELLGLLLAVIKDDHEEVRLRIAFLAKVYGITTSQHPPISLY